MSDNNPQWGAVPSLSDGNDVRAETFNRPIMELAARTEYLWRMIKGNDRTKVVVQGVTLIGGAKVGQPVYRDSNGAFAPAQGLAEENSWFYASQEAMAVGVVAKVESTTATSTTGDVVLYGHVAFEDGIQAADLIADEGSPVSGRYYLSARKGMLTSDPNGPVIYVCDCQIVDGMIQSMLVNPQYRDTGESHIHRAFLLDALPVGKYVKKGGASYEVYGIFPNNSDFTDGWPAKLHIVPYGSWHGSDPVNYTFEFNLKSGKTVGSSSWADYEVTWTSGSAEGAEINRSGSFDVSVLAVPNTNTLPATVGDFGLKVRVFRRAGLSPLNPAGLVGNTWTVSMPDDGRAWIPVAGGYDLNLGMYSAMARFVPPNPANGAALIVDGLELSGPVFPDPRLTDDKRRRWEVRPVDGNGGPWLHWYGNAVVADGVSVTTPFKWTADYQSAEGRDIVLHVNRMRVGPTGFVTSLQPAPGSPLVITSALTDSPAVQGALQIDMDVDFKSEDANAAGFKVVKRIEGNKFITGPVVERVVAGPGVSVNSQQGTVRVSVSNAVYAGDFETIALKNAKQDLAGGVFPYTKLLGWTANGSNVKSGFTAKFRVPDHIPYKPYYVVVSASVFGDDDWDGVPGSDTDATATFTLTNYTLADHACSDDPAAEGSANLISSPDAGYTAEIGVPFSAGYKAFDPVLLHGFSNDPDQDGPGSLVLSDDDQRKRQQYLWLRTKAITGKPSAPIKVYPGWFVGLEVERCASSDEAVTEYTAPIGFLSLRWNLVEAPAQATPGGTSGS